MTKFKPQYLQHDDPEQFSMQHQLISENGLIRIGIYRVMFGWRIRAGFSKNMHSVELDWCAGGDWTHVEYLYAIALVILGQRPEDRNIFDGIPTFSAVKPFFLDRNFTMLVLRLAGDAVKLVHLKQPTTNTDYWLYSPEEEAECQAPQTACD